MRWFWSGSEGLWIDGELDEKLHAQLRGLNWGAVLVEKRISPLRRA
jgi:hypothetical protein